MTPRRTPTSTTWFVTCGGTRLPAEGALPGSSRAVGAHTKPLRPSTGSSTRRPGRCARPCPLTQDRASAIRGQRSDRRMATVRPRADRATGDRLLEQGDDRGPPQGGTLAGGGGIAVIGHPWWRGRRCAAGLTVDVRPSPRPLGARALVSDRLRTVRAPGRGGARGAWFWWVSGTVEVSCHPRVRRRMFHVEHPSTIVGA